MYIVALQVQLSNKPLLRRGAHRYPIQLVSTPLLDPWSLTFDPGTRTHMLIDPDWPNQHDSEEVSLFCNPTHKKREKEYL